jgi:hypothetical protein
MGRAARVASLLGRRPLRPRSALHGWGVLRRACWRGGTVVERRSASRERGSRGGRRRGRRDSTSREHLGCPVFRSRSVRRGFTHLRTSAARVLHQHRLRTRRGQRGDLPAGLDVFSSRQWEPLRVSEPLTRPAALSLASVPSILTYDDPERSSALVLLRWRELEHGIQDPARAPSWFESTRALRAARRTSPW